MRKNLFEKKIFTLHSGSIGYFKIECDALTDDDIDTLAYIISRKFEFNEVIGIPRGGIRIAKALEKYKSEKGYCLIVDDVLTTGNSMEEAKKQCGRENILGIVLFGRGECPDWIIPVFKLF